MKNKEGLNQSLRRWHLRILARVLRHKCSPLHQSGCASLPQRRVQTVHESARPMARMPAALRLFRNLTQAHTMNLFDRSVDVAALGKVAVLLGGRSAEREISLRSGRGVLRALQTQGVDAHAFDPAEHPMDELKRQGFARCFIALHGRWGEDGTVQGALELLGIPYTGSGVLACSVAMDKAVTKQLWRAHGLPTPEWQPVHSGAQTRQALERLGAPMIVKPAREGSTLGLSKVHDAAECEAAWALAARFDSQVLCEQFIAGDETTCAVIGHGVQARALPAIRICAPGGNYDYQNKYFGTSTQYHCPSGLPQEEEQALRQLCEQAWHALGCRGWARADVMIRARDRRMFLLEINTCPGMTDHSLVPMAARAAGISYEKLCLGILAAAALDHAARP